MKCEGIEGTSCVKFMGILRPVTAEQAQVKKSSVIRLLDAKSKPQDKLEAVRLCYTALAWESGRAVQ